MNKIVFIKLKNGCKAMKHFEDSFTSSEKRYYNISDANDAEHLRSLLAINEKCYVMALVHKNDNINKIYLGNCTFKSAASGYSGYTLMMDIQFKSEYNLSMKNICKLTDLNLDTDFQDTDYISIEESKLISEQIEFILSKPSDEIVLTQEYNALESEESLNPLAQKNEYCRRRHNLRQPMNDRSEYQRDYERIVHSKAFRRMVDKAQVFSASKGDYYRTRMTHSQAVDQIARGIAVGLNLNMYLTEAIALGHDIGHTPFGHQGERTLDDVLHGKFDIIKNIELYKGDGYFGGFKHNYQSLRVASLIEEEYYEIYGMDLRQHRTTKPKAKGEKVLNCS